MKAAPTVKILGLVAAIAVPLHLIWENAQAPLFGGYENFWQHFWICLKAIPGDTAVTLLVYLLVAAWRQNPRWVTRCGWPDLFTASIAGAAMAVGLERYALVASRWSYRAAMPVIPGLGVGLLPVLQMALIPAATFLLVAKLALPRKP